MTKKDQIFSQPLKEIEPFKFNHDVAEVFDDMVSRSIPFYDEIHRILADLATHVLPPESVIVDLGCSTGTTLIHLASVCEALNKKITGVGIDNSAAMIAKAHEKKNQIKNSNITFEEADILNWQIKPANMVIMNYTLQFISPNDRDQLLNKIYQSLKPNGILVLSEKISSPQSQVQDLITTLYYDFKRRNGYSELEISQKREALENVLVPITPEEQIGALKRAGFERSEMIFRWYNFASYIGWKKKD
ncbi:MAG: carboxy-S-adenosyl-L-methionine synthase CmoA [Bdellovibrio sp. CG12_big_fil_rev_8_21_14_0_65_39_13]|nr:MAG: carboxy-S-adenosyl-L-methionine synthase CmoA [Bdellovibrio sp. CG22_combo_CG10-13_8_21_14_all_39_27]PIQ61154.1 MAG: carboxy-S-adenosyl-L-methionine synthase CmoA [Bdellovibrio sp. CG12_big_fil_rev_8_21_14_0_65_39_13]PIR34826.1 MAG: carboxy-S-adenosyl-L-methionine synthase CmoA [Bdellovibrio sp. CG11_big_fil_rev_8_21_14_0_20_39_38]PJB53674.1 MAG: carboxy-S-adenosyl-L-methionine synthase CmoA [Bdellovibrio sp. CG_4_9_14_3_um_filter_39_7]